MRLTRHAALVLVAAFALSSIALPLSTALSTESVAAATPNEICPKKAAGLPRENAYDDLLDYWASSVSCVYAGHKNGTDYRSVSVEIVWHDLAAAAADPVEMETLFCDAGDEGDRLRLFTPDGKSGIDLSRLGHTKIYAIYRYYRPKDRGAARKLAAKLLKKVEGQATQCAGGGLSASAGSDGSHSEADGARRVELILSGARLDAMRSAGGVGATILLIGDEGYGLVVRGQDGEKPLEEDYIGSLGRVVEIGVVATDEAGQDLVSVTVEVLADDAAGAGDADSASPRDAPDDGATDADEPESEVVPDGPAAEEDDATDPAGNTEVAPDTESDPSGQELVPDDDPVASDLESATGLQERPDAAVTPGETSTEDGPGDAAGVPSGDRGSLQERLAADLDRIEQQGSGFLGIAAEDVERIADSTPLASSVEPGNGYLRAIPTAEKFKFGRVYLYPELDARTGDIHVRVAVAAQGFEILEQNIARVKLEDVPAGFAGPVVDSIVETYRNARARGLKPTGLVVTRDGIGLEFEVDSPGS